MRRPATVVSHTIIALLSLSVVLPMVRAEEPVSPERSDRLREDLRALIESARDQVFPALVHIHVSTVNYWGGKERKGASSGSGTIISKDGYVVTNQHVTNQGKRFRCTLADKQEVTAELIGEDALTDLAVIKLDLSELKSPGTPLAVARFGSSSEIEVGDYVMAMGSPLSLSRSVTLGIVSNTERVFAGDGADIDAMQLDAGQRTGLFTRWIQHDALIQPGNSGGPLVNLKGEIIGVNELGGNGIGFAIPSDLARQVVDDLIAHGEVPRSAIGVSFKSIRKTGFEHGVLINSVIEGSPAAKAGVEPGDLVLRFNGEPLTVRFTEQIPPLLKRIADSEIGSTIGLTIKRGDETLELSVTTEKLDKDIGSETVLRGWGVTAAEITPRMALERRLPDTTGAMVSGTRSGSPAQIAEPPLQPGDIIRRVGDVTIASLADLIETYTEIQDREELPEYLLIEFDRWGKNHLTVIKPRPVDPEDPPRSIRKAWIGVATQPIVQELAQQLGHPEQTGFRITRVYPRTTAAESDLQVGDIIIALNGDPFQLRGMQDASLFQRQVKRLDIDGAAKLTVLRKGETKEITVTTERTRWEPTEARRLTDRDFEMTVRNVTFFDRDENQWDENTKGVIIESIERGSWAAEAGLRVGDLIQEINGMIVKGRGSFRRSMEKIGKDQPERVRFKVLRGIQTRFQFFEPEWSPKVNDPAKSES